MGLKGQFVTVTFAIMVDVLLLLLPAVHDAWFFRGGGLQSAGELSGQSIGICPLASESTFAEAPGV